jgi:hypothetical protein
MGGGGSSATPDASCTSKTSGCRVEAFNDWNFTGTQHGFGHNDTNVCSKDCNICVNIKGISSYKVLDCPETVVPVGHYRENGYAQPMGTDGPLGYSLALKGDVGGVPNGWDNNIWGLTFHTVPEPDANQIKYDMPTYGITADGSGTGEVNLPKQGISADRDDVILATIKDRSKAGRPCPSGTGYFMQGATKVRCLYGKTNDAALRDLHTNKNGVTNDPRASMHANLKEQFCSIPDNWTKNPGGGSCMEWDSGKTIGKQYCGVGNRIATDGSCTVDLLGKTFYDELAVAYCRGSGKSQEWCSCYNVTKGVCDTDSTAAGCSDKRLGFDKLVEKTPEGFKGQWTSMEGCFGGVCIGNKYIVDNANQNCSKPVQICVQEFDFASIADSTINATCNQTADTGGTPSVDNGTGGTPTTYPDRSIGDTLDVSFRSNLPEFMRPYVPVTIDEIKSDSKKQLGIGGVSSSSMLCCCILLMVAAG